MWQLRRNIVCGGGVGTRASEGEGVGRGRWARPTRARARAQAQLDEVSQVRAWSGLAATAATSGFLQEARNLLVYAERAMEASGFRGSTLAWMNRMTAQALLAAEEGNEEWFHTVLESVEPHLERAEQTPIIVLAEIHMARMAHGCEADLGVCVVVCLKSRRYSTPPRTCAPHLLPPEPILRPTWVDTRAPGTC